MTKKEPARNGRGAKHSDAWKGIVSKEDYDKLTGMMSAARKKAFDEGLDMRDANLLMSLGGTGLYEPMNRQRAKEGKKPLKKDFSLWR